MLSRPLFSVGCNFSSVSKFNISTKLLMKGMDAWLYPTVLHGCDYLSMSQSQLNHVSNGVSITKCFLRWNGDILFFYASLLTFHMTDLGYGYDNSHNHIIISSEIELSRWLILWYYFSRHKLRMVYGWKCLKTPGPDICLVPLALLQNSATKIMDVTNIAHLGLTHGKLSFNINFSGYSPLPIPQLWIIKIHNNVRVCM